MKKKTTYRIRNWREYNRALKQRGSLTLWISSEAIANWTTEQTMEIVAGLVNLRAIQRISQRTGVEF